MTNVTISDKAKDVYIGSYAFASCSKIKRLIIPTSVTKMDKYVFSYGTVVCCKAKSQPEGWAKDWNNGAEYVFGYEY